MNIIHPWTYHRVFFFFFFFFCFLFFVLFGQVFLRLVMRTQKALERGWDSRLVLLGMCCWEFEIGQLDKTYLTAWGLYFFFGLMYPGGSHIDMVYVCVPAF